MTLSDRQKRIQAEVELERKRKEAEFTEYMIEHPRKQKSEED